MNSLDLIGWDIALDHLESRINGKIEAGYFAIEKWGPIIESVKRIPGQIHTYIIKLKNDLWAIVRYENREVIIINQPQGL